MDEEKKDESEDKDRGTGDVDDRDDKPPIDLPPPPADGDDDDDDNNNGKHADSSSVGANTSSDSSSSSHHHNEEEENGYSSNDDDDDEEEQETTNIANNSNNNNNKTSSTTIHVDDDDGNDEDGHALSEYELLRLERIRRNKEKLAQLGLLNHQQHVKKKRNSMGSAAAKKQQQQQQQSQDDLNNMPSRSSLSRSSKRNVNYAEPRGSLLSFSEQQYSSSMDQVDDNDNQHRNSFNPSSTTTTNTMLATATSHDVNTVTTTSLSNNSNNNNHHKNKAKKPRMAKFIFREFQRIQGLQHATLKQAERNVRSAQTNVRHWIKLVDKYQRHLERQYLLQQLQQQREEFHKSQPLRDVLREMDSRMPELLQAARDYEKRQQSSVDAEYKALQRQEKARTMETIDALDRFPKVMKRYLMGLNKLLVDRAPRDPPPPRRSKRKTIDSTETSTANRNSREELLEEVDEEERPVKKVKTLAATSHPSTGTMPVISVPSCASIPSSHPSTGTMPLTSVPSCASIPTEAPSQDMEAGTDLPLSNKKRNVAKNVGGWISPQFSQEIDRRWLERNTPETTTTFRLETYVPQVGDTVLYYPEGHRLFLKAHPDVLGRKTRAIARLPLWERAQKEKQKNSSKRQENEEELANGVHNKDATTTTSTTTTSTAQPWWDDEWLQSIDNKGGVYPILCRVEKTHAEFPPDPSADEKIVKKDSSSGHVQVVWKQKTTDGARKREQRPPLRLAVALRALTPVKPPARNEAMIQGESQWALPPKFSVVIFPSAVARPFVVPFSWAYSKFHSLMPNSLVSVHSPAGMSGNMSGGKVISFENPDCSLGNLRLDDQAQVLATWLSQYQQNSESTSQAILDTLSHDFRFRDSIAPLPLADALSVVETWMSVVKRHENGDESLPKQEANQQASESLAVFNFKYLVQGFLPVWNGVSVARDAYDRRRVAFSPWDLELQLPSQQPKSTTKTSRMTSEVQHLTTSLDGAMRLKIELTLEDFLKGNEDAEIFCPLVLDSEAPYYSCAVPLGMAFRRILSRLEARAATKSQCYYRHADAVLSDIGMIEENCLLYNSPDSELVERAGRIVMEVKHQLKQIFLHHYREEQRQRFIQLQCDSVVENKRLDKESSKTLMARKHLDCHEMFTPFNDTLYRDWLQDFEPDGSWNNLQGQTVKSSAARNACAAWVPQAGDRIFYSETAHAQFVRAHYHSLTDEQCELPRLLRVPLPADCQLSPSEETADPKPLTNGTLQSQAMNAKWVLGTIQRVKVMFPRRRPKQDTGAGRGPTLETSSDPSFRMNSPILALEIRFDCEFRTIYWRPCEFQSENDACPHCGLLLRSSFLHPAWLAVNRGNVVLPEEAAGLSLEAPSGLMKEETVAVNRCLNLLKRRCISGPPPDFVDRDRCIADLKRGIHPSVKIKASSLPSFEDIFHADNDDVSRVGTRGVRVHASEKHGSILAEFQFLPRWAVGNSKDEVDIVDLKRCAALFPCPNLSLELVQLRLRQGFYRQKSAILNDIEEAYIQSVLFLLSGPATRKKNSLSIKKLARLLSLKSNDTPRSDSLSEIADPALSKSGALDSIVPLTPGSQKHIVNTSEEETLWTAQLEKIRRLYVTALFGVGETRMMELMFGTLPKGKIKQNASLIVMDPVQEASKQKLDLVLEAVGRDPCLNRFGFAPPGQSALKVKLKITCGDAVVTAKHAKEGTGQNNNIVNAFHNLETACGSQISFDVTELRSNNALARIFFGRPAKMNACARCQAFQRSMVDCRVIQMHSNIDFDWVVYCREFKGVDFMLQQLQPDFMSNSSTPRFPPANVQDCGLPETCVTSADYKCDSKRNDEEREQPTMPSCTQRSNTPLLSQGSLAQTPASDTQRSNSLCPAQDSSKPADPKVSNTTDTVNCDKKSEAQASAIGEAVDAFCDETAANANASDAADGVDKESETKANDSESANGADKETETQVDPREDLGKATLAARLASDLLVQAKAAAEAPARLHRDFISLCFPVDPADGHYVYCVVCGLSGDLLCCDGCPNVLHQDCAGLSQIPEGDWFCEACHVKKANAEPSEGTNHFQNGDPVAISGSDTNDNKERSKEPDTVQPNDDEKWRSKFIGIMPYDFEKEAELTQILDDLRSRRIKSQPSARNSEAAENSERDVGRAADDKAKDENQRMGAASEKPTLSGEVQELKSSKDLIQIGFDVSKDFGRLGSFVGKVISLPTKAHPFYGIRYEDGDEEDMTFSELQDNLPLHTLKKLKAALSKPPPSTAATPDRSNEKPALTDNEVATRRPKGRPRKSESLPKRPRGRPRKDALPPASNRPLVSLVQDLEEQPIAKQPRLN